MAVAELGCARDRLSALNRLLAEAVATLATGAGIGEAMDRAEAQE